MGEENSQVSRVEGGEEGGERRGLVGELLLSSGGIATWFEEDEGIAFRSDRVLSHGFECSSGGDFIDFEALSEGVSG